MPTFETWADRCRELARRIRKHCLRMTHRGHSGHVGSLRSMAEILSVLYTRVLNVDPGDPRKRDRDRFVLSKGHGGCAVYAVLGELGFFRKAWFEGYYRCGYKQEPPVHRNRIAFGLGRAIQVGDGRDLTFIFTGTIGNQVTEAAEALSREGIQCRVLSMHTVNPIDRAAILAAAEETGGIVVVEEHQLSGGLGGAVAEVLADACVAPRRFLRIGLPDVYVSQVGSHEWLLHQYGLSAQ